MLRNQVVATNLVTRGTSRARRTNGTSQTTGAIFARRTISTFGTSITLRTGEKKNKQTLRLPDWGQELSYSVLQMYLRGPPQLCQGHKVLSGVKGAYLGIQVEPGLRGPLNSTE